MPTKPSNNTDNKKTPTKEVESKKPTPTKTAAAPAAAPKKSNKKDEVKVVVIDENNDDDDEEEEEEEEDEDDDEDEEAGDAKEAKQPKEKKPKKTFTDFVEEYDKLTEDLKKITVDCDATLKTLNSLNKKKDDLNKNREKVMALLSKCHEDDMNKALKNKTTKHNGNPTGGFNRVMQVPKPIVAFCKLPADSTMNYPQMMKALSDEFIKRKLKDGQNTTLDKDSAKIFKKDVGHVIEQKRFMTFIKEMVDAEKPTENTVAL
jgi:hypothetical protein